MKWVRFSALAFVLHFSWEMAQMPLYRGMGDRPWRATVLPCSRAAVVDVAVTLAVGVPFFLIVRRRPSSLWPWVAMVAAGAVVAIAIEKAGLGGGRWAYAEHMPQVPWLRLGVPPIVQMALIPGLSAWLTLRPRRPLSETAS
jgi:hypothetical protein